jgi:hypothetical protein
LAEGKRGARQMNLYLAGFPRGQRYAQFLMSCLPKTELLTVRLKVSLSVL